MVLVKTINQTSVAVEGSAAYLLEACYCNVNTRYVCAWMGLWIVVGPHLYFCIVESRKQESEQGGVEEMVYRPRPCKMTQI